MAKKQGATKTNKWNGFFNYYLEDGQKEAIKKLPLGAPSTERRLTELAQGDYKVSITFSADKSAFFVSCTGTERQPYNAGWSLTQAHSRFEVAVACAWYIITEIFNNEGWPVGNNDNDAYEW